MPRHHRDRDILWLTSGLPFLTWASAPAPQNLADGRSAARPEIKPSSIAEPGAPASAPVETGSTGIACKRHVSPSLAFKR